MSRLTGNLIFAMLVPLVGIFLLGIPAAAAQAGDFPVADKVVVEKSARKLHLLQRDKILKSFNIALGLAPDGDKHEEGDFKTPEGTYYLDTRNNNSDYFLSIRVSYPNADDVREAAARGVSAGGQIMIHGQPNSPTYSEAYYQQQDWTNGCIAVSNSDMIDIWLMTPNEIPIEIRP
jgi:murein L,D-transpeptidase YafK